MSSASSALSEVELLQPQSEQQAPGRRERNRVYRVLEERLARQTALAAARAEEIRELAEALILVEQRERSRLAADLHDYLAQLLVACHLRLAAGIERESSETALLKEADDLVRASLAYTRTLVTELSPAILCEAGIAAAIRWLAEQMSGQGLHVRVVEEGTTSAIPEQHATLIFRSVRELLFNVVKHAGVTTACVSIYSSAAELSITVEDQGRGCDPPLADHACSGRGSFGLHSIRQRLTAIGGGFEIRSVLHEGTRATVWLPLTQPE